MKFGAFIPQGWRLDLAGINRDDHWDTMVSVTKTIENSNYISAWVYDHFHTVPLPTQEPVYEAWTLMAALAAVTDTVRLGQMCTCNSYRNPAYLAKVASSIDVISKGRVEMGIGAGWYDHEYRGYGYPFDKPSIRIGRLKESVEIMRAMWTEDSVTYDGKHYQLDGAMCQPKPVQDPMIPVWIAGGGEKLTLRVAAQYADYTNFGGADIGEFIHKSAVLARHCYEVGRDFSDITRSCNFNVVCAETEAEVEDKLNAIIERARPFIEHKDGQIENLRNMLSGTMGTPEQLVAKLTPWATAGMGYGIAYFPDAGHDTSSLELFAAEVVPNLG
ncbi:Coenzyme F420-dependent oxidoreductase [hydrothermal vent metagenome]|uniref:Coenzyme F420-dependent oxidoreductase n=1 Tax=hydrothermal vent metagenome TaxID=652676 RepID=A0A3B0S994_9ZZZZ